MVSFFYNLFKTYKGQGPKRYTMDEIVMEYGYRGIPRNFSTLR